MATPENNQGQDRTESRGQKATSWVRDVVNVVGKTVPGGYRLNPEARQQAESLVTDARAAVVKHQEEGVPVPTVLFKRTMVEGKDLLNWSDTKFANKLGVSDQGAEMLLEGKSVPLPATRGRFVEFMADKVAKRYKIQPSQQERPAE